MMYFAFQKDKKKRKLSKINEKGIKKDSSKNDSKKIPPMKERDKKRRSLELVMIRFDKITN